MLLSFWNTIKPAIFWDYRRASWQWDLIVAGILAFIFLTPAEVFHDGPRAASVERLDVAGNDGEQLFLVTPEALRGVPETAQSKRLEELLEQQTGSAYTVVRSKASTNDEGEVHTYVVYARPGV